jgi:hypothetical protein
MYLKMSIYGFALDSIAQMPVVILKNDDESAMLPIWINSSDALTIVAELIRHDAAARSDRKDLLASLLEHLDTEIGEIALDDMKDGLFDASVSLAVYDESVKLPVRIAEALVIALKKNLPLMVADHLLTQSNSFDATGNEHFSDIDGRRFVDYLENLDPADLGKYPM